MKPYSNDIPENAKNLAQQGLLVEAIKITRNETGLGLKEAKDAVEAYLANPYSSVVTGESGHREASADLPVEAVLLLEKGRLIDAIKVVRKSGNLELKTAKETVERYLDRNAELNTRFRAASAIERKRGLKKLAVVALIVVTIVMVVLQFQI